MTLHTDIIHWTMPSDGLEVKQRNSPMPTPPKRSKGSKSTEKSPKCLSKENRKAGTFSREKGKRGERDAVKYLNKLGFNAKRTSYGQAGRDKEFRKSDVTIVDMPDVWIEIKFTDKISLNNNTVIKALDQSWSESNVPQNKCMVLWRQQREPWKMTFAYVILGCVTPVTVSGDSFIKNCIELLGQRNS
mgnify:CR=1 FL=1